MVNTSLIIDALKKPEFFAELERTLNSMQASYLVSGNKQKALEIQKDVERLYRGKRLYDRLTLKVVIFQGVVL